VAGEHPQTTRLDAWLERRLEGRSLRPRLAAYLLIGFWLVAILVFGIVERLADPQTFPTIWLAWWWGVQTVSTVGYGDIVPQQASGKAMATVLMLGGLSMIALVTAAITSGFVARRQALHRVGTDPLATQLDAIDARLAAIEEELRRARVHDA
jgi:voltage-gated potassium channel